LYQALYEWDNYLYDDDDDIADYIDSQIDEYNDKIKLKRSNEKESSNTQTHPQAIYTSRRLNFKNLSESVNSSNLIYFLTLIMNLFTLTN
jgi:hypothetical protein